MMKNTYWSRWNMTQKGELICNECSTTACLQWLLCSGWRGCIKTRRIMMIASIFLIRLYPSWHYYAKCKMYVTRIITFYNSAPSVNNDAEAGTIDAQNIHFLVRLTKVELKSKDPLLSLSFKNCLLLVMFLCFCIFKESSTLKTDQLPLYVIKLASLKHKHCYLISLASRIEVDNNKLIIWVNYLII